MSHNACGRNSSSIHAFCRYVEYGIWIPGNKIYLISDVGLGDEGEMISPVRRSGLAKKI